MERKKGIVLYLMLDDEPLDRRSIVLVDSEDKAKILVEQGRYEFYQEIESLSDDDVKDSICDNLLSEMDTANEFFEVHCRDCDVSYDKVCPYR